MTTFTTARMLLCSTILAGFLPLAGCGSSTPETTTTTTTEQSGAVPPAATTVTPLPAPGTPGTITTQTTHTQTNQ
jgi:hypothetical protein